MKVKQDAGRNTLGVFAPKFAALNDDVLFGEVWQDSSLDLKTRSIITICALVSKGMLDSSFTYHIETARKNGVSKQEMAAILTHLTFYAGWPNAWVAFRIAKDIYKEDDRNYGGMFGLGELNTQFSQWFTGKSYLKPLTNPTQTVFMANVTFEPKCRNNWHIHHAKEGGGQILLCTSGRGWYQEWGKEAQELNPGDVVVIKNNVKHWHGAAKDSWFSHIALEVPGIDTQNEWLEKVDDITYDNLE